MGCAFRLARPPARQATVPLEDALADDAAKKPSHIAPATVAMEYAGNTSSNRIVKFYVFDFGISLGRPLRPDAELDTGDAKIAPNL